MRTFFAAEAVGVAKKPAGLVIRARSAPDMPSLSPGSEDLYQVLVRQIKNDVQFLISDNSLSF